MYFASMVIAEGGTTATEAAVMGTPTIHISPSAKKSGNHWELQNKYKLKYFYDNLHQAKPKIFELLIKKDLKKIWVKRKRKLLKDKIDVTKWMIEVIENEEK
jgi:predicted glycosyltransferase